MAGDFVGYGKKSGFFLMSGAFNTEGLDKVLLMSQQP
jgi:hypothetical protein